MKRKKPNAIVLIDSKDDNTVLAECRIMKITCNWLIAKKTDNEYIYHSRNNGKSYLRSRKNGVKTTTRTDTGLTYNPDFENK